MANTKDNNNDNDLADNKDNNNDNNKYDNNNKYNDNKFKITDFFTKKIVSYTNKPSR